MQGDEPDELHESAFGVIKRGGIQISLGQGLLNQRIGFLQLQEEGVRASSVRAMVEARDVGGNHFLEAPGQMTV